MTALHMIGHLLRARYFRNFTDIISLNVLNSLKREIPLRSPFPEENLKVKSELMLNPGLSESEVTI